jgi:hypothetical protein
MAPVHLALRDDHRTEAVLIAVAQHREMPPEPDLGRLDFCCRKQRAGSLRTI